MKISNSKKELARIISENGGWQEHCEWAVQDKSGEFGENSVILFEGKDMPVIEAGQSEWMCAEGCESDSFFGKHVCDADKLVKNWHQTILSREEYFHLYPAPDADGWIQWNGEPKSPVDKGTLVDVKMKSGEFHKAQLLDDENWSHSWGDGNIVAYRLHKPEQTGATEKLSDEAVLAAKIALMSDSIEELVRKPSIEQLAADYRNRKDYADRKQEEADAAKADADAALCKLEYAGEAIGLLVSPIKDGRNTTED